MHGHSRKSLPVRCVLLACFSESTMYQIILLFLEVSWKISMIYWIQVCSIQSTKSSWRTEVFNSLHFVSFISRSDFRKCESLSVVSNSLWSHGLYSPWNSPGQNTTVGSLSLLQGIFPTQGLNTGLPHCRFFTSWATKEFVSKIEKNHSWFSLKCGDCFWFSLSKMKSFIYF